MVVLRFNDLLRDTWIRELAKQQGVSTVGITCPAITAPSEFEQSFLRVIDMVRGHFVEPAESGRKTERRG